MDGPRKRDEGQGAISLPLLSLAGALASLLVARTGAEPALELARGATLGGEWWRLVTAHVAHFDARHLWLDVALFAVLGAVLELRDAVRTRLMLLTAAPAVSAAVLTFLPEIGVYRGLSGLGSALLVQLVVELARERTLSPRLAGVALALFAAKLAFEALTSSALFATSDGSWAPVPLAHLVGGLVGLGFAFLPPALFAERRRPRAVSAERAAVEWRAWG